MKRLVGVITACCLFLALMGCDGGQQPASEPDDPQQSAETSVESSEATDSPPPERDISKLLPDNRSQIQGEVLSVREKGEHQFELHVRVTSSQDVEDYRNMVRPGDTLVLRPNFRRHEGKEIDYSLEVNRKLGQAGQLSAGAKVQALVYLRRTGEQRGGLLMDWQRADN